MFAQVFDNSFRLSDDDLLTSSRGDADERALSQWVYGLQVISSAEVLIALEDLDLVLEIQLFKQPDYSLRPRLLEPS